MTRQLPPAIGAPLRSPANERANVLTHAGGLVLSLGALVVVARAIPGMPWGNALACLIFAFALVSLYTVSTLSHLVPPSVTQDGLRAWDQGMVYVVISATYTPFIWTGAGPRTRLTALTLIWVAAAWGFFAKVVAGHRVNAMQTYSYLLLGWLPAVFLRGAVTQATFLWIAAGGVSYTVGVLFLKWDDRWWCFHAAWHACVVGGSACHFAAVYHSIIAPEISS